MNSKLLVEVLQWLQQNNYRRASFDRLIGIIPSATTYDDLYELLGAYPDIFREARIKGGLTGLAVQDEVTNLADLLDQYRTQEQEEIPVTFVSTQESAPAVNEIQPIIPRVTVDEVEAEIVSEDYLNGARAIATVNMVPKSSLPVALGNLTICILVLANGFTVVGTSACVNSALYDEQKGRELARADAVRQIWPLLGFRLADRRT